MPRIEPEIAYHQFPKREDIEQLVREKIEGLDKFCDHIDSCSVVIEKPNENVSNGTGYRVRVDLRVAPSHEIVAVREADEGNPGDDIKLVIRQCFDAVKKQLVKLVDKQQGDTKVKAGDGHHKGRAIS